MLEIDVSDNGAGIPEKVKSQLFNPFMSSTKIGNSGLGLSIARDVVVAHGGTISIVVSGPGRTVFSLRLPVPVDS
jgi:signal transduction histidine kinase